jgi:hypothetical protein
MAAGMRSPRSVVVVAFVGAFGVGAANCADFGSPSDGPNDGGGTADSVKSDGAERSDGSDDGGVVEVVDGSLGEDALKDPDLLGAWNFDGTGEVAVDISGHGNDAVLVAGATQEPGGVRGGALVTHGLDRARVDKLSGTAFPGSGTLTLYIRYVAVSGATGDIIDGFENGRPHLFLRQLPSSNLFQAAFQRGGDGGAYSWELQFAVPADKWTPIALTWDEASSRGVIYVNGSEFESRAYELDFSPTGQLLLFGKTFIGQIDEVRLYKRVLGRTEIARIH